MSAAKKPRKEQPPKAFNEYTVAELQAVVKQHGVLKTQLEERDEEIAELQKAQKDNARSQSEDAVLADRTKAAVSKQFLAMMLPEKDLSEKEVVKVKGAGREVSMVLPNVSASLLAELGLDKVDENGQPKGRQANTFFGKEAQPVRSFAGGTSLRLVRELNAKYVKTRQELRISSSYKFFAKPKPKPKATKRKAGEVDADEGPTGGPAASSAEAGNAAEEDEEEAGGDGDEQDDEKQDEAGDEGKDGDQDDGNRKQNTREGAAKAAAPSQDID